MSQRGRSYVRSLESFLEREFCQREGENGRGRKWKGKKRMMELKEKNEVNDLEEIKRQGK
jgi:hypothetical protein